MAGKPRGMYTDEFKDAAVMRVKGGETIKAVSADIGVGYQTLWYWCRHRDVDTAPARGHYKRHDRCPCCGASSSHWRKERPSLILDLSKVEPVQLSHVHFLPTEHLTELVDGEEWVRYDPESASWACSGCGYELMGGEGGWFDMVDGSTGAKFCPGCGHPIAQFPGVMGMTWKEGEDD